MGIPTAEQPPAGLDAYWLGVWRHALKVLKEQKTWTWEQRPLLDEYVFALIAAKSAREADEQLDWHRSSQRAAALADQLVLTVRAKKAQGIGEPEDPKKAPDPLDGL